MALGMGAQVTLIDKDANRLRYLEEILHGHRITVMSNRHNIERSVAYADLVIGAVLVPGARAPQLVTEDKIGRASCRESGEVGGRRGGKKRKAKRATR